MKKLSLIMVLVLPFLIRGTVHAQEFDAAFGAGTLTGALSRRAPQETISAGNP